MPRFVEERRELIELLRSKGIKNERVLEAMMKVERHRFVMPTFIDSSYLDQALPIGNGQTISQPYTVAFMSQALEVRDGAKVLEIGTGSGYQAAVLAEMGCRVFTIERHMPLHLESRKLLQSLGYRIATRSGDGTVGWSEYAPYDGIIVTAAAPSVPEPLLRQLADGGRLVIPVGGQAEQSIRVMTRAGEEFIQKDVEGFKFVPLIGKMGWEK
jgi:protein-L-isoaspartate(D-aspartate) O-methyltransferase